MTASILRFARGLAMPAEQWRELDAPIQNGASQRSADNLRATIAQFEVETANRYQPRDGLTFCNIFSWDATRALGCEIPHWVGETGRRTELNCNLTLPWLVNDGPRFGWRESDEHRSRLHASAGGPAVAIWRNPTGKPGHIAVLMPSADDTTRISQAGGECLFDVPLEEGFGRIHPLRFFFHA